MAAALLIVHLGSRPSPEFLLCVDRLKSYGFRWNNTAKRWQRYIEEVHAERLIKELAQFGIRARKV